MTEWIVASSRVRLPYPLPSAFVTDHPCPPDIGIRIEDGAGKTVEGEMPFSRAATRANGLKEDPDCRPVPPSPVARFTRAPGVPSQ